MTAGKAKFKNRAIEGLVYYKTAVHGDVERFKELYDSFTSKVLLLASSSLETTITQVFMSRYRIYNKRRDNASSIFEREDRFMESVLFLIFVLCSRGFSKQHISIILCNTYQIGLTKKETYGCSFWFCDKKKHLGPVANVFVDFFELWTHGMMLPRESQSPVPVPAPIAPTVVPQQAETTSRKWASLLNLAEIASGEKKRIEQGEYDSHCQPYKPLCNVGHVEKAKRPRIVFEADEDTAFVSASKPVLKARRIQRQIHPADSSSPKYVFIDLTIV